MAEIIPIEPDRVIPERETVRPFGPDIGAPLQPKIMHLRQFLISLFLFFLLPCAIWSQSTISGHVVDEQGRFMVGATVAIPVLNKGVITAPDGSYALEDLAPGPYQMEVRYLGYRTVYVEIDLKKEHTVVVEMIESISVLEDVLVGGTWAGENDPIAYEDVSGEELARENLGQDVPMLLRWTPSMVVTSDAGNGIGYTGMRIRGTDASRINVTINGIPLNDAESHGVFWVDLPDFAASTESIQIQRGVGTSTNGSGAFGATVNLSSNNLNQKPYGELFNSFGSFNSRKHSLKAGTGLINKRWSFDTRLSLTKSDGYIDRARSDLNSAYLSAGYYGDRTIVKGIYFTGHEVTYQSWYGTPESRILNDAEGMLTHAANEGYSDAQLDNLLNAGRTYNFYLYDDQVDDYRQDHYQLHLSHAVTDRSTLGAALHYTKGQGFFEQFREGDEFSDYGLAAAILGSDTIQTANFVRRRWLDNDYLGYTANWQTKLRNVDFTFGNAFHHYNGDHFGEIIWASVATNIEKDEGYYDNTGIKNDLNFFAKANWQANVKLNVYADMQFRKVDYKVEGIDSDLRNVSEEVQYNFFNPKAGLTYAINNTSKAYASFGVANKEPNRNDLIDRLEETDVLPEQLLDLEIGYEAKFNDLQLVVNFYNMSYNDQLVLTGALNDVGTPIRTNVDKSFRRGVELQVDWAISKQLNFGGNLTLSQNQIKQFEETIYDYTNGFDIIFNSYDDTAISFSPNTIAAGNLTYRPNLWLSTSLLAKYVGKQYLDNTENENRSIAGYFINDFRLVLTPKIKRLKQFQLMLNVYNLLDTEYSSNGYTYSYVYGDAVTENFYYPQAGRHFMGGLLISF